MAFSPEATNKLFLTSHVLIRRIFNIFVLFQASKRFSSAFHTDTANPFPTKMTSAFDFERTSSARGATGGQLPFLDAEFDESDFGPRYVIIGWSGG
jgi:hypothetical protein